MSRYEEICDMLRARRRERDEARARHPFGWGGEKEYLAVVHDALIEIGLDADAEECARLMNGFHGDYHERYACLLVQQPPTSWPLQSELDA